MMNMAQFEIFFSCWKIYWKFHFPTYSCIFWDYFVYWL